LLLAALAANAIEVIDDAGARVVLEAPATRIVSIAPHLTEQLFAIGAGHRIVATTDFADYPPAARAIPRVARAHHVDLEQVAALKPDLIVIWGSGFPPAVQAALKRLNVPLFVSEPKRLDDVATSMLRLGTLTAAPDAEREAAALRSRLALLRATYANRKPVNVFYQIWPQPLMTLSGKHVVSEAITLCGGVNVFADLAPLAPQVIDEAVLAANPDAILAAEADGNPSGALDRWRKWPQLSAVRRGALVTLTAERINRHGPRISEGVSELCKALDAARD
jgi:iron complex transport system substrate-binding protein